MPFYLYQQFYGYDILHIAIFFLLLFCLKKRFRCILIFLRRSFFRLVRVFYCTVCCYAKINSIITIINRVLLLDVIWFCRLTRLALPPQHK